MVNAVTAGIKKCSTYRITDTKKEIEMLINKITPGFVIQTYNTATGKWVSQSFVAGDDVSCEDGEGNSIDSSVIEMEYLAFNMVQPSQAYPDANDDRDKY